MEADVEIEALRAIFGDEITIETDGDCSVTKVRKKVRPNDEEGVSSASLVVEFELGPEYPEVPPKVHITNPRGISEQSHHQLIREVNERINESIGLPIMFDVLQHCADFILENQHSSSLLCPICLCPMMSKHVSATPCDHYAHSDCLELHVEHTRKQLGEKLSARDFKMCDDIDKSLRCPVCRLVIEKEVDPILPSRHKSSLKGRESTRSLAQEGSQFDFEFDWERWRQQQASLLIIYEKQKEKGGIIDLEEERKKTLVTEDTVVILSGDLEGLVIGPSLLSATDNNLAEPVHETAAEVSIPSGFVDSLPTSVCANTLKSENHSSYHKRNTGRKFHDPTWSGHHAREYRGGHRPSASTFVKKDIRAVPDTSISKVECTSAEPDGHSHSGIARPSDDHSVLGLRMTPRRGSYHHKSPAHWRQLKSRPKSSIQVDRIHE